MSKRNNIAYRDGTWFPMPKVLGEIFTSLSHPALKLYLALAMLHKGRVNRFTVSNLDLMRAADVTRKMTFLAARAELISKGLIYDVEPTTGSKRIYGYRLVDVRTGSMTSATTDATDATDATDIRWVPRDEFLTRLSPTPSLEGRKGRKRRKPASKRVI